MSLSELKKNFISLFRGLSEKHKSFDVWSDFITVTAIAIIKIGDSLLHPMTDNEPLNESYWQTPLQMMGPFLSIFERELPDTITL